MKKPIVRIIALVIVFMLVLGLFSGALAMLAGAAEYDLNVIDNTVLEKTGINEYTITFDFSYADMKAIEGPFSITPKPNGYVGFDDAKLTIKPDEANEKLFHVIIEKAFIYDETNSFFYFYFDAEAEAKDDSNNKIKKNWKNAVVWAYLDSDSSSGSGNISQPSEKIMWADTTVSKTLTTGKVSENITIKFRFLLQSEYEPNKKYNIEEFTMPVNSSFGFGKNTELTIKPVRSNSLDYYEATLKNATYTGGATKALEITTFDGFNFYVPIPSKFIKESGEAGNGIPTSDIVVQSTIVRDAQGNKLGVINKDSGRFTVEITFYDIGLKGESNSAIDAAKKYAFITSPAGFKLHTGSAGKVERVASSAEYPRFKATFENVESTGTANTLNFRVQYDFEEYEQGIKGEAVATLFQINSESSEESEAEAAPLKPNVIVQEYSYGEEAIVAGSEFNLDLVFTNTSRTVAVENVVMKVNPASGFEIRAASNTVYFPSINAGESKPYSVAMRALPSQNAGVAGQNPTDYSVTVEFTYQYLMSKKDYGEHSTSVKIAIPVEQLDRFTVDEITDYSQYVQVGNEGYLTVPITNKGKSVTMNISGTVESKSGAEFTAPPVYYGNLEAGKSATMNISIVINTPGEFTGEVVIMYEDENENQKEVRQPFTVMVDEPVMPPPVMPQPPEMQPPENKLSPYSVVMFAVGGLMLASPAAMILMKRIKARGNEDLDEDF